MIMIINTIVVVVIVITIEGNVAVKVLLYVLL